MVYDEPPEWGSLDWLRHDFFTKFIPNEREYRIHVVRGQVIRVQRKYLDFPDDQTVPEIKNFGQGYRFRTPRLELNRSRTQAAVNAVAALGLDFGGVDMIVDRGGQEYVLEVNTAPKCSPLTVEKYVAAFRSVLEEK